ncbi:hypothetical protein B0W44_05225 [Novibacillus thermophilus]|uniref:Uncharacterized protein n=1 Tax=Novibacillus thermophilus TaxID=1471761 RepID=A0A1U9K5D0_9BACL|nr:hypothetical protein B0W44_05225 [Novibacillus thermophilus]
MYLVTGDMYEDVEIVKEVPSELKENVSELFIGVKSDTSTVYISPEMIVSIELENTTLKVISS